MDGVAPPPEFIDYAGVTAVDAAPDGDKDTSIQIGMCGYAGVSGADALDDEEERAEYRGLNSIAASDEKQAALPEEERDAVLARWLGYQKRLETHARREAQRRRQFARHTQLASARSKIAGPGNKPRRIRTPRRAQQVRMAAPSAQARAGPSSDANGEPEPAPGSPARAPRQQPSPETTRRLEALVDALAEFAADLHLSGVEPAGAVVPAPTEALPGVPGTIGNFAAKPAITEERGITSATGSPTAPPRTSPRRRS